jgi:hypothetical protein
VVLCYDITICSQKSLEQNLAMHDGQQQVLNKFTYERLRGKLCSRNKSVWIFAAMLGSTNDQLLPPPVQMLIPLQHLIPDPKSLDYTIIPGVRAKSPDL